jgi:zinc/manganese transport system substrate-binding protein
MSKMSLRQSLRFLAPICLLLSACSANNSPDSERVNVVVTTTILGDVVSVIGGENIDLNVLLPADSDPHTFEPAPRDAAIVSEADLLVVNGLGLETFLDSLLTNAEGTVVVTASDGIAPMEGSQEEEHEGEDEHEEEEAAHSQDPHVWQDPTNVIVWAQNIAAVLSELDPANADTYEANADAYIVQLNELDAFIIEHVSVLSAEQRVLVTDHEALGYFAHRYEFEIIGVVVPSVSTVAGPSAQEMAALQQAIEKHRVPAIFIGTSANPDQVSQLADDLGIEVVAIYGEALSAVDGPAPTYLEMMRYNVDAIVNALR